MRGVGRIMRSRRLLVIYTSNLSVCGVGTWVETLSEVLTQRGWDVTIGLAWGKRFHQPAQVERARPSLQFIRMDARTGTDTGRVRAIRRTIRQVSPDVVLITLLQDGLDVMVLEKQSGSTARFGVAIHGNAPEHLAATIEHAGALDLVGCVNRSSFEVLRGWQAGFHDEVLHYVPNAVPEPKSIFRRRSSGRRIGFVGRLHSDKRVADLRPFVVRLIQETPDFEILVAGQGPEERVVKELSRDFPKQVHFLGALSRETLYADVYPNLDVLVSFSPSEGWPMAIAEAMVHGVVPVSSEFTGIHLEGIIRHFDTGVIFPVGEAEVAAASVAYLFNSPEKLAGMAARAAAEMRNGHSLDDFGNHWDKLLSECLARPAISAERSRAQRFESVTSHTKEWFRRLICRHFPHETARSEWPTLNSSNRDLNACVAAQLAVVNGENESITPT